MYGGCGTECWRSHVLWLLLFNGRVEVMLCIELQSLWSTSTVQLVTWHSQTSSHTNASNHFFTIIVKHKWKKNDCLTFPIKAYSFFVHLFLPVMFPFRHTKILASPFVSHCFIVSVVAWLLTHFLCSNTAFRRYRGMWRSCYLLYMLSPSVLL